MDPYVYKRILENIRDAIVVNQDGKTKYVNSKMLELLGYSTDTEIIGKGFDLFVHPDDYKRVLANHERRLQGEKLNTVYEFRVVDKNGKTIPVEIRVNVFEWEGRPATLNFLIDITERKNAEAVLQKSEERLHELFRNSSDIISIFDITGNFLYVSPSLKRIAGYLETDLVGKNFTGYIHPADLKSTIKNFSRKARQRNKGLAAEFRFRHADGSWIYLEALGYDCLDNPAINGIIINARDVSGRRRMEEQLLQAQKMEAIGALAGGIAHDFNNLLMGIQGNISLMLLRRDSADPDFRKLKSMESLVQSGADLAAKLLGFARGGQYELKSTDLNELVSKTVNVFGRTKREIMIHQKYGKNVCPVEVDRVQIEQVLINLYVNAWQAMPGGGGDIYVETDNIVLNDADVLPIGIPAGAYVRIMVTDTGMGMDEETRRRIFEPFFTTKEKGRGVGLGLASAYGIIKKHGGIIDVTSEPGHGTIFTIYLPASSKEVLKETIDVKTIIEGNETILLVDDEESIVDVCGEMLGVLGYNVLQAKSGKDALKIYEENKGKIDLVILDMIMPGLSGGETFEMLKLIDPEVKVMLSTGYIISEQAKKMMQRGCRAFIQKPFLMDELSQKIREVFDRNE